MKKTRVIFIHGFLGARENFAYLLPYFENSVAYDVVGFGLADKPDAAYDAGTFVSQLEKIVTEPSVFITHSMGGMIAKEFFKKHPKLVRRVYAINYPLAKSMTEQEKRIRSYKFYSDYLDGKWYAKWMCKTKMIYKWLLLPFMWFSVKRAYFTSYWRYYNHSYHSASRTLKNFILKDDVEEVFNMRDMFVMIAGEKDFNFQPDLLKKFRSYTIPDMKHSFFGFENKIVYIIKEDAR